MNNDTTSPLKDQLLLGISSRNIQKPLVLEEGGEVFFLNIENLMGMVDTFHGGGIVNTNQPTENFPYY